MRTVAEMPIFSKQADDLFAPDEKAHIIDLIATAPELGDEIPRTGGVRKLRVPAKGKGKRGGGRVIYYWHDDRHPILALLAYPKNAKTNLTRDEEKAVRDLVSAYKSTLRSKK